MRLVLFENGTPTEVSFKNIKEANDYMHEKRIANELEWTSAWTYKLYKNDGVFEILKSDGTKVKKMPTYQYSHL